jgi:putative transposase
MLRTVILECTLQPSGNRINSVSGPEPPVRLRHVNWSRVRQGPYAAAVPITATNRHDGILNFLPQHPDRNCTACWRGPELNVTGGALCLTLDSRRRPITIPLPEDLALLPPAAFREVRLGWHDEQQRHYWQVVVAEPRQTVFGQRVAAVDLGSVYPATLTDGEIGVIFDVTRLKNWQQRAARKIGRLQYGFGDDRLYAGEYRHLHSEEWLLRQAGVAKTCSFERLVSQTVLAWAVEHGVGTLVVGDADGLTRPDGSLPAPRSGLEAESLQTRIMRYLAALARGLGVVIRFVDEALTSQTCPGCARRNRAHGRRYKCAACGFHGHRDVVGSSNLLSRYLYGDLGQVWPVETVVYRPAVTVL